MEQVFLQGKIRDRIQDLMKSHKVTQAELAARIGCSESMLSRFISGKTDKLGDENIIRIARVFNVSTDFLLGHFRAWPVGAGSTKSLHTESQSKGRECAS